MLLIPTQELYDKIFEASQSFGFDTYDYLPAKEVDYPFVQLANTQQTTLNLKTAKGGLISQTIHVWGTLKMRYQVTQMMEQLNQLADGTLISIDCTAVENEVADNMYQRSEMDWLIYNASL